MSGDLLPPRRRRWLSWRKRPEHKDDASSQASSQVDASGGWLWKRGQSAPTAVGGDDASSQAGSESGRWRSLRWRKTGDDDSASEAEVDKQPEFTRIRGGSFDRGFTTASLASLDQEHEVGPGAGGLGAIAAKEPAYSSWVLSPLVYTSQGPRHANEDRLLCSAQLTLEGPHMAACTVSCFAVFDGHGGPACAQWLAENLESYVAGAAAWSVDGLKLEERLRAATEQSVAKAEADFMAVAERQQDHSGACMVMGMYCEGHLCVCNVGDCLALLYVPRPGDSASAQSASNCFIELSVPHRSRSPEESQRIEDAGGVVSGNRAFGILEPSRTIGDLDVKRYCKGAVVADPYIRQVRVPPPELVRANVGHGAAGSGGGGSGSTGGSGRGVKDLEHPFLVFASDGLWDVVAKPQVVTVCRKSLKQWRKSPAKVNPARQLVRAAVRNGTMDDTTVIVVDFAAP